jgi:hypothetical protein
MSLFQTKPAPAGPSMEMKKRIWKFISEHLKCIESSEEKMKIIIGNHLTINDGVQCSD